MIRKLLSCALAGLALLCAGAAVPAQDGGEDAGPNGVVNGAVRDLASAVRSADLIVVGQVEGMVDTRPEAATRKTAEVHWVVVQKTLKGYDVAGRKVKVRPNGLAWADGGSYVLFLLERGQGFHDAIVYAASLEKGTLDRIAELGGGARPRADVRVMAKSCACCGEAAEVSFALLPGGKFELVETHPAAENARRRTASTLVGQLAPAVANALVARLAGTPAGPLADCGGDLFVEIAGAGGNVRYVHHSLVASQGAELLGLVREVAREHGKTPNRRHQ